MKWFGLQEEFWEIKDDFLVGAIVTISITIADPGASALFTFKLSLATGFIFACASRRSILIWMIGTIEHLHIFVACSTSTTLEFLQWVANWILRLPCRYCARLVICLRSAWNPSRQCWHTVPLGIAKHRSGQGFWLQPFSSVKNINKKLIWDFYELMNFKNPTRLVLMCSQNSLMSNKTRFSMQNVSID